MKEVKRAYPLLQDGSPLHISLAGITYPDPTYRTWRSKSSVTVIEYILDGEGYIVIDGTPQHVNQDKIYILPAGIRHEYFADKEHPFTKIFMNIEQSALCNTLLSAFGLKGKYIFDGNGLKEIFERILVTIHSEMSDSDAQSVFHGIFTEIISRLQKNEHMAVHSDEAIKLKGYLDKNLNRIVTGRELASVIFRSTDYCLKLFRREFGITPYAYQLERKMQAAKTLLYDTRMSVGEIAESLGYEDVHYFSNLFCSKCGMRPLEYRKKQ